MTCMDFDSNKTHLLKALKTKTIFFLLFRSFFLLFCVSISRAVKRCLCISEVETLMTAVIARKIYINATNLR
jgi:hypothetical protein